MSDRLELAAALLLRVMCIHCRHALTGVWPGPRWPMWVFPLWPQRPGRPRDRFAMANPYCVRYAAHWQLRSWYPALVAHFTWTEPAPVVYIGRPPVREKAMAA